jgi:Zn-dependent protease with chaperone function
VVVAVGARAGRYAWGKMSKERRQVVKDAFMKRSGYIVGGLGGATACGVGYYIYHIEEAPLTKRNRFMMINREKLLKMIDLENEAIVASLTMGKPALPTSHALYDEVVPILNRVIPIAKQFGPDIQDLRWTVTVLDSPDIVNAVCLPSGDVFVHSGLLKACRNRDEIAFILSHEVAHVLMNHGGETFSKQGVQDFFLLFVTGALWFMIPNDLVAFFLHRWSHTLAEVLFHLPYSRQIEDEADTVGLILLSSACYEPSRSVEVWSHFPSNPSIEYLSTHPLHETRLDNLRNHLPTANEVWEVSECRKMQVETASFKRMVNKITKMFF